jgi:hypothetical protein
MVHFNPVSVFKNTVGLAEGLVTGNPVQAVASTVKLSKSFIPFADFIPGLEEFIDGAISEVMDAAVDPVVDVISGTATEEVVHEIASNMQDFCRKVPLDRIRHMADSNKAYG